MPSACSTVPMPNLDLDALSRITLAFSNVRFLFTMIAGQSCITSLVSLFEFWIVLNFVPCFQEECVLLSARPSAASSSASETTAETKHKHKLLPKKNAHQRHSTSSLQPQNESTLALTPQSRRPGQEHERANSPNLGRRKCPFHHGPRV